jgi:hypothetical protein
MATLERAILIVQRPAISPTPRQSELAAPLAEVRLHETPSDRRGEAADSRNGAEIRLSRNRRRSILGAIDGH